MLRLKSLECNGNSLRQAVPVALWFYRFWGAFEIKSGQEVAQLDLGAV